MGGMGHTTAVLLSRPKPPAYCTKMFPSSVKETDKLLQTLQTDDVYSLGLRRHNLVKNALSREANRHSVAIEAVEDVWNTGKKNGHRVLKDMMRRQENAWNYALERIAPDQHFGASELATIASLLVPGQKVHPNTGYRLDSVLITGASHVPPAPYKVDGEMMDFFVRYGTLESPLEKAIYSHFHIARIHPFSDGNGRTARTVQNAIMCGANQIPIIVATDQRDLYIELLDTACRQYYKNDRQYLHAFSEFLVYNLRKELKNSEKHPIRTLFGHSYE
jgi:Fic family protein